MTDTGIIWPKKTRDLHNHHMNSTVWDQFKMRDDDIVLATYAKSGTTWTQQILAQLIFNGNPTVDTAVASPWVDLRIMPPEAIAALEHQPHRRFLKTHLPLDALVFSPRAKYIYVGRDGRDVVWSMYNHHANANGIWYDALNNTPGRVGPPIEPPPASVHDYYRDWMAKDGFPFWSYWDNVRSWWSARNLPNVKLVHFNDLKRDLPGSIRGIAQFLDIPIDEKAFPAIVEHCTFDYMKSHAETVAPLGGILWEGGAKTFINKGTNGRWTDTLSADECKEYEARAIAELGPECAAWLSGTKQQGHLAQ
jgi:aryl sulfotransferase